MSKHRVKLEILSSDEERETQTPSKRAKAQVSDSGSQTMSVKIESDSAAPAAVANGYELKAAPVDQVDSESQALEYLTPAKKECRYPEETPEYPNPVEECKKSQVPGDMDWDYHGKMIENGYEYHWNGYAAWYD